MKEKRRKSPCILAVVQCIILIAMAIIFPTVTGMDTTVAGIFTIVMIAYGVLILIFGLLSLKFKAGAVLLLIFSIFINMLGIFGIIGGAIGIAGKSEKKQEQHEQQEESKAATAATTYTYADAGIQQTEGVQADAMQADSTSEGAQAPVYSDESQNEADYVENKERYGPRFRIKLYDTIVSNKDWKAFRRSASEDDLAVLAVGSRYRLSVLSFYVKAVISVLGMIFSIVFGIVGFSSYKMFAIIVLVAGYVFFNLLASKLIGYSNTYSSCYRKLSKESCEFVNSLFKDNVFLSLLREIVIICLCIITIPYKFILLAIEMLIPPARNWAIAHGSDAGAVITMPKGYDIGSLGTLGAYYASCKFEDAFEEHLANQERERLASYKEYKYTDKYGVEQTAYSNDGTHFYSSPNSINEVGTSNDGGNTINLK